MSDPATVPPRGPARSVEARLDALEAGVEDIKDLLARLEPVLGDMDDRIRDISAEKLPTLEAEVNDLRQQVWRPGAVLQLAGTIGGVVALVVALAALGLLVARVLVR